MSWSGIAIAEALAKLEKDMDDDPLMQEIELEGTTPAPEGQVYVCGACGKTSPTRYGFDAQNKNVAGRGWDESCMLNAVLCHTEKKDGAWQAVEVTGHKGSVPHGE